MGVFYCEFIFNLCTEHYGVIPLRADIKNNTWCVKITHQTLEFTLITSLERYDDCYISSFAALKSQTIPKKISL